MSKRSVFTEGASLKARPCEILLTFTDEPSPIVTGLVAGGTAVVAGILVLTRLGSLPEPVLAEHIRRWGIALRIAQNFPYSIEDIYPLTDITQDESLIRGVLADYVGVSNALELAKATLLSMREEG